ncbi:elongation factor G [Spirulina sp. 06S082]|uniref:elongation factor G n=1 Tax=Spirulina sp. 06S082 TaxID=3110248 RepID=UPI002B216385|nr:elongation factor G [Spirulina sp. 06S082]MEA5470977.1 elongation factor G [Spirulina sp. 06S082]
MTILKNIRNIGISAHIDSGKTTLSERILFYTGKIHKIEEVRGGGNGATMDYAELEKLHGITINSAATTCLWHDHEINLIDTPGHVDFTIEVERALRVLDGAVMVLCAVAGVQSQSVTVDRQMKRYRVPRLAFINKMDRAGANPFKVVQSLREKLNLNPLLLQYPIGTEAEFEGIIDLITLQACYFLGEKGEEWVRKDIPDRLHEDALQARDKLLDTLSFYSEEMTGYLLMDETVPHDLIWQVIREATLRLDIVPVLMGSAYKNKGVQNLLDAVTMYLPSPGDRETVTAFDITHEQETKVPADPDAPLVALAFKLTDDEFGQLTYLRIYAGTLRQGAKLLNTRTQKTVRVSRLVRMHADERQELKEANAGAIVAVMGIDCASGDTLCSEGANLSLEGMFVPDPVITLAITPKTQEDDPKVAKALHRFVREDPTLHVSTDPESGKTLISGMGELHLAIYIERMQQEYNAEVYVGQPAVAYRETITDKAAFDYQLKKQSGGPGQYAHITGVLEPCEEDFLFCDRVVGGAIPKQYIPACEKGFKDAIVTGYLQGYPIVGVKVVLQGGSFHSVDSNEMAFRSAAKLGFEQAFAKAKPVMLEPIMAVEVETPAEFTGRIQGNLLSRRGVLVGSEVMPDYTVLRAEVPLAEMFGYSTQLRSLSSGMATFSMELSGYKPLPEGVTI